MLTLKHMAEKGGYNMLELKLHLRNHIGIGTLFTPCDLITRKHDEAFDLYFAFYPIFHCNKALPLHWNVYEHHEDMSEQLYWFEEKYRAFYNQPSDFFTKDNANDNLCVHETKDFVWLWWD